MRGRMRILLIFSDLLYMIPSEWYRKQASHIVCLQNLTHLNAIISRFISRLDITLIHFSLKKIPSHSHFSLSNPTFWKIEHSLN